MARKLYLHIGNHKTGTTSIQSALAKSGDVRVFNDPIDERSAKKFNRWFGNSWVHTKGVKAVDSARINEGLAAALAAHNPDGDVIFSAEDLSWVWDRSQIEAFANALSSDFNAVEIIAYIRRQDRNAVSFYQDGLVQPGSRFARFMGHKAVALPKRRPFYDRYFNYHQRLGLWADVFGDEAMRIQCFGDVARDEGVVTHFQSLVDMDLGGVELELRKSSPKALQLLMWRATHFEEELDLPMDVAAIMFEGAKALPPRAKAEAFYLPYRASNIALQERFRVNDREAVFDEDFSEYPLEGYQNWDDEAIQQALDYMIYNLAKAQAEEKRLRRMVRKMRAELREVKTAYEQELAKDEKPD